MLVRKNLFSFLKLIGLFPLSGDKDDDDDDDADDKIQSSVLTGGEEGRQESQEQNEVDHGDFEMVVSKEGLFSLWTLFDGPPAVVILWDEITTSSKLAQKS